MRAHMQIVQVDESADGQEIGISVGGTLEVRLPESPTTGFRWDLVSGGQPVLEPAGEEREPAERTPGSGGWHRWRFRAEQEGMGGIELQYVRLWESDAAPARVFRLDVRVE
jgi:inhibitor of cysteine peptidase